MVKRARESENEMLLLVNTFEPLIKKCIKIYIKDPGYYEDGMQQGRMTVINCIRKYDITSSYPFQAYVKRGVYYSIRDFGKKLFSSQESLDENISEDGPSLYDTIDSGIRTDEDFLHSDEIKRLYHAMEGLSEKQRSIIDEVFFKNRSMKDICNQRRCHYMTVASMKERALLKLKILIENNKE